MHISKFLLNRQKIFNPWEIHKAIETYFPQKTVKPGKDYFYRLEWYKIGVVVPVTVYSKLKPEMQVLKEFQLFESNETDLVSANNGDKVSFSVFLVPDKIKNFEPDRDFDAVCEWFKTRLKDAAEVSEIEHGPDNCLYYDLDDKKLTQQTITLKGQLVVKNKEKLEKICSSALGLHPELGCGLLYID
jgi:hypothetical protein